MPTQAPWAALISEFIVLGHAYAGKYPDMVSKGKGKRGFV